MKFFSALVVIFCAICAPLLLSNTKLACEETGKLFQINIVKPSIRSGKESVEYSVQYDVSGSQYMLSSYYQPNSSNQRYWSDFDRKIVSQWFEKNKVGKQTKVKYHCWFPRLAVSDIDSGNDWVFQVRLNITIYLFLIFLIFYGFYILITKICKRVG